MQVVMPTPRPDRISADYEKECPAIEVESRKQVNKKTNNQNMENVKLDGEVRIVIFLKNFENGKISWGKTL